MDVKEFMHQIQNNISEINDVTRRVLPIQVGNMAVNHFKDNFRKGGFVDNTLFPWKPTQRQQSGSKSANASYSPLTSGSNHLMSSIQYIPGNAKVTITNKVLYAPIHNEGGTLHPRVTPKLRGFAWRQYYDIAGIKKGEKAPEVIPEEARKWKAIALTKKSTLNVRIPKRQFIGNSGMLGRAITLKIQNTITNILQR